MAAAGTVSTVAPPREGAATVARRIPEFDVLRGAAIIFVVYLHTYFSPWDVTPRRELFAMHLIHLIGHTAVPVFFFVSAFLLARDATPTFREFATRKLRKIYVPLLFWMLAALAYGLWRNGGEMTPALWKALILFDISGQHYFLVVLIVFIGGFYFLRDLPVRTLGYVAGGAFAVNLAAVVFYEVADISDVYAYRNPAVWVFFYAFGFYSGRKRDSVDALGRFLKPGLAAMAVLLAAYLFQGEILDRYPVSYFGTTVFLFSCASLVVYPSLARQAWDTRFGQRMLAPVAGLSRYAFAIYLVHMPFFVGWLTNALVTDSALNDDYFKLMTGLFVVGFSGSLAFVMVVAKVAPRAAAELLAIEPGRVTLSGEPRRTT